ncbi:MAG: type IV pilus assembly protein PilM [bacterium]
MFNSIKYPIGLDISDTSLKFVQLKKRAGLKFGKLSNKKTIEKLEVNCYNSIKLPPGLIINGEIKNQDEVAAQINKLLSGAKGGKITNKNAVAVLPQTQTFIKLLQIPKTPEEEMREKISEEIVKHVPLILDEVYIDWQIINRGEKELDVLVGAAPKKIVDQYIKILEQASLQPIALEIEAASICRCLIPEADKNENDSNAYLIIDLGANRSSLIVCSQKTVYFTINAPISGNAITKQIADSLKIDINKAQKAKQICGLDKNKCKGIMEGILNDMINNLIDHIQQAVSFFQSNYPQKQIQKIILCGGGGNFLEIDKVLFGYLKIPVIKGNAWIKVEQNKNDKYNLLNNDSLSYATAIGLALRGFSVNE